MPVERLIPNEEALQEELKDPEFRRLWERTALARWLAVEVAHYRTEHELSQRDLADRLGVQQPDIARMELGEHTPSWDRLIRIVSGLGIEMMIDIRPHGSEPRLPRKRARRMATFPVGDADVLVATTEGDS
jgi:DNA-binding XRE family transcriptional regulator